ncbi:MBL fold metallo-hydrolase [Mycolicibacterium palauense]|uniref:MBL fold metallo-hydrolase n=1 Tax=Mycolicibacterium palauense TaxID=2034511 RepID=UPI000BFEC9F3|nr:MBL fold metallo-hydrolase [Mycolicibacterium palauense]
MAESAFGKGLVDLGGGVYGYLSGSTDFGLSNAGLVVAGGEALVVDTLYDVAHAQELVDAIGEHTGSAPVRYVFNTHSDGDHIFGNQLFSQDVEVIATVAAAALMTQEQADLTAAAFDESADPASPLHPLSILARPFDFHPVRVRPADTTFSAEKHLRVGAVDVELHELGPAHTVGDAVAYLPEKRVLFAGDLLTRDIVKVVWSGSVENWIAALERIRAFDAETVVPGHGPVLVDGQIRAAIDAGVGFWSSLHEQAATLFARGVPVDEAASRIDVAAHPDAVLTLPTLVAAVYHGLDPQVPFKTIPETLEFMAAQVARLGASQQS